MFASPLLFHPYCIIYVSFSLSSSLLFISFALSSILVCECVSWKLTHTYVLFCECARKMSTYLYGYAIGMPYSRVCIQRHYFYFFGWQLVIICCFKGKKFYHVSEPRLLCRSRDMTTNLRSYGTLDFTYSLITRASWPTSGLDNLLAG